MIKKHRIFILLSCIVVCISCKQKQTTAEANKVLQLQQSLIVDGKDHFITQYHYDNSNKLIAVHSNNISGYDNIDSITYDAKNRIIYFTEQAQEDNSVNRKKTAYSADGKTIKQYAVISYADKNKPVVYDTAIHQVQNNRIVKSWYNRSRDTVAIQYNDAGEITFEGDLPDTPGYTNPLTLVGDKIFWAVLRGSQSLDAAENYGYSLQVLPKYILGIDNILQKVAGKKKYPAKATIAEGDSHYINYNYTYKIVEKK